MIQEVDNVLDMIDDHGEEHVKSYLQTFSSPLNKGIENFIKKQSH